MTVSDFLKDRNLKILARYKQLKAEKLDSTEIKKIIGREFGNLSVYTIEQVLYNKNYSNSPHKKE
ncbi:hypothetical protein [Flavobacterium subsaxonicum]|uniref:Uncharacterized protein n=1 Tax=Flavobacterium subsaxonicum WB 4.1-42 = DSM 21790 TaxID=1121898 RepID=A0A0A2MHZ5_9FLAO|nr:hypothetical protein [Flavobacterium subsaxonicum]KGO91934.1 hypothetical protein Q766_14925 [Flavobacterium subsaxonicum WB 4.1-42 = DSM 21790]